MSFFDHIKKSVSSAIAGRGGFNSLFSFAQKLLTKQKDIPGYATADKDFFLVGDRKPKWGTKEQKAYADQLLSVRSEGSWDVFPYFNGVPLLCKTFTSVQKQCITLMGSSKAGMLHNLVEEKLRTAKGDAHTNDVRKQIKDLFADGESLQTFEDSDTWGAYMGLCRSTDDQLTADMHSFWCEMNDALESLGHKGPGFELRFEQAVENIHMVRSTTGETYMVKHHGQLEGAQSLVQVLNTLVFKPELAPF